jgi:uncharacterized damage-inducible protein DinB
MKKVFAMGLMMLAACTTAPRWAHAQDGSAMKAEMIGSMMDAGGKIQELAAAMPDKKYDWRPGKGVRSVREVYLHVVTGNYLLSSFVGAKPPMPVAEIQGLEKTTPDKAKIAQMLKDSYAFASDAINNTPDSEMETQVNFYGTKMSKRAMLMVLVSHSHEHLGQSIAYARMNGVTPPWTARQEEAAKKAAAAKKTNGM